MSNMDDAVAACGELLAADADRVAAALKRDAALWRLVHEDGLPVLRLTNRVRTALLAAGYTPDQIGSRTLGLSYPNVRLALKRAQADS